MSNSSRSIDQLPTFRLPSDYSRVKLPLLARTAREIGPICRSPRRDDSLGSVSMIGPEANRFVLQSHRMHFSHDQGWTPQVAARLGHGLLNMDPPDHDAQRKMMNPAFTIAYMARYLPVMQRTIADRTRQWAEQGIIELHQEMRKITFNVVAETLIGFQEGPAIDRLRELFYTILYQDIQLPPATEAELKQQVAQTQAILEEQLQDHHGATWPATLRHARHPGYARARPRR